MIFLAPAESWSLFFGGGLHENGVKIPGVFGANVPTAHTTDTAFFFGLAWIGFVDRAHRTTGSTNAAIIASIIGFRFERNVGKFLVCAMTSGKVQLSENIAIKFFSDFPDKFRKFLVIIFIRTTSGKLPENGMFSHGSHRRHTNKSATFKSVLQFSQSVVPLPIAVNTIQNRLRSISCNLFNPPTATAGTLPANDGTETRQTSSVCKAIFSISQQISTSQTSPPRSLARISATFLVPPSD